MRIAITTTTAYNGNKMYAYAPHAYAIDDILFCYCHYYASAERSARHYSPLCVRISRVRVRAAVLRVQYCECAPGHAYALRRCCAAGGARDIALRRHHAERAHCYAATRCGRVPQTPARSIRMLR